MLLVFFYKAAPAYFVTLAVRRVLGSFTLSVSPVRMAIGDKAQLVTPFALSPQLIKIIQQIPVQTAIIRVLLAMTEHSTTVYLVRRNIYMWMF